MIKTFRKFSAVLVAALACSTNQAAPIVYFGEDQNPAGMITPAAAPATAQAIFLGQLVGGVGTETFETKTFGSVAPLVLSFPGSSGSITATLNGNGVVFQTPSTSGRFNTTGASAAPTAGKWWQGSDVFSIDFSAPISAFGFYGTDIGDFTDTSTDLSGKVTVALTDVNNVVSVITINNTVNGNDASLLFWGFVDTAKSYKKITFGSVGRVNENGEPDFFGFDDFVIGDLGQIAPRENGVPEPGTFVLLGLAMIGAGAARRYRR